MKNRLLTLLFFSSALAGYGQQNITTLNQNGQTNGADIQQTGNRIEATVTQTGTSHNAIIRQTGTLHIVELEQLQNRNRATITQDGSDVTEGGVDKPRGETYTKAKQDGDDNVITVLQHSHLGAGVEAYINQTGNRNEASVTTYDMVERIDEARVYIDQVGNDNRTTVRQNGDATNLVGDANYVKVVQTGDLNRVQASQETQAYKQNRNVLVAEQIGTGNEVVSVQRGGTFHEEDNQTQNYGNIIRLRQEGMSHYANLTQDGNDNHLLLTQQGSGNRLTMNQTGNSNEVDLLQDGTTNMANLNQTGENNRITGLNGDPTARQIGTNNTIDVTQTGGQIAQIYQNGINNAIQINQTHP